MKYHPDKNSGDKEAEKKFQLLKEAKETLCDAEKRQLYDKWKNSGLQVSYKNWIGMKEHVVSKLLQFPRIIHEMQQIVSHELQFLCLNFFSTIATIYALGQSKDQRPDAP